MNDIKFIELFAGIGGFRYGLEKVGQHLPIGRTSGGDIRCIGNITNDSLRETRGDSKYAYNCVYANEFNKYAAQIYERNFNDKPDTRDITTVPAEEIPDHELLVGGFPCQAFSIAGKRGGFEDTRGTLFFEIARIAKQKQPRLLLLENVKGLLSHDQGKTFGTILNTLSELGYDCEWQVLNSKDFGVPQNRERVFIIGHLRGTSRPKVFPIKGNNEQDNTGRQGEITQCLTSNYYKQPNAGNYLKQIVGGSQGYRVYNSEGISSTLAGGAGGVGAKTGLYAINTNTESKSIRNGQKIAIPTINPDRENIRQSRRFKEDGDPSYTLVSKFVNGVCDGVKIRRLTPTECERLQGFPDGWTKGISDTQRYKCLGNAVTTNVITAIGERLV